MKRSCGGGSGPLTTPPFARIVSRPAKSRVESGPQRPAALTNVFAVALPVATTICLLFPSAVWLSLMRIASAAAGCFAANS